MWWNALTLFCFVWICHTAYGYHGQSDPTHDVPSTTNTVDPDACVVDLGFVLDGSGSVGQANWDVTIDYVKSFANTLTISPDKAQIGVVLFGNDASVAIDLDQYNNANALVNALDDLEYLDENTNTAAGIRMARNELFSTARGDRANVQNVMIILTDGYPTREVNQTIPESQAAYNQQIQIFTIGVGNDIDMTQLYMLAFNHSEHSFTVNTYSSLAEQMNLVLGTTCHIAETGFTGDPQENDCDYDIGFVIDGSGSVGQWNWDLITDFLVQYGNDHISGDTRIGVVTFGNDASVEVSFTTGSYRESFAAAAANIPYRNENTNTAAGLRVAREQLFTYANGAREEVPDRLVLITDGYPTYEYAQTRPEADLCRAAGITVFTLGVGDEVNYEELLILAGNDSSRTGVVPDFNAVAEVFVDEEEYDYDYSVGSAPITRIYLNGCECPKLDLALILDASGSIGEEQFSLMKMFATTIVDSFPLSSDQTRLAVVSYSSEAGAEFVFNTYDTPSQYRAAINALSMRGQRTNIKDALHITSQNVLISSSGDRQNVQNLVILISDGRANMYEDAIPAEVQILRDMGTPVLVIGVGLDADMVMLRDIASEPETTFFRFYDHLAMLVDDTEELVQDVCRAMHGWTGPQENPHVDIAAHPSNVLFFLTTSNSNYDDWVYMREYVASQLEDDRVHLSQYNFGIYTQSEEIALGTSQDGLAGRVRALQNPGPTTAAQIQNRAQYITNVIDSSNLWNEFVIVLITNYLGETEAASLRSAALLARNDDIPVFLIVGGYEEAQLMNRWYMDDIASEPASAFQYNLRDMEGFVEDHVHLFEMIAFQRVESVDNCDFEYGYLCGAPDRGQQASNDDFDWTIRSGSTPSRHTGPGAAYRGESYAYIEASYSAQNPIGQGDFAELILPFVVEGSGALDGCMTFMYHMRGYHIGALQVLQRTGSRDQIRWQLSGPQTDREDVHGWRLAAVPLHMTSADRLCIRGIRGEAFSGDVAIDDVQFKASPCAQSLPRGDNH